VLKRQWIYLQEMYPVAARVGVAAIIFFELYFVLLLNYGVTDVRLGAEEAVGTLTVFTFLMLLRIADDFKDYETDKRLFAHRALPSGRVTRRDLRVLLWVSVTITVVLNVLVMNNLPFFVFLYVYGTLMSLWFFQRDKIQPNLMLALVTHNPVIMVMNVYVISFTCIKYGLDGLTWTTLLLAFTLYFPGLIWEIARKIRAPGDETEYTTYSKVFGYRKVTRFIMVLTLVDVVTNLVLVYRVNRLALILLVANVVWITVIYRKYIKDPERFSLIRKVDRYAYGTEAIMILAVAAHLLLGYV
jgi:4-hydroxybenzoate polyprenyltransferase